MSQALQIVQMMVGIATLVTLAWGLQKMFKSATEARAARNEALEAARRAEAAAVLASVGVKSMGENVQKIEIATNSMKDALVLATGEAAGLAGEKRGRETARRESKE